jgi:TolB-like protein/tetratricopeptide (TPR) repeat protein/predicted Ser/Thr protein kinase
LIGKTISHYKILEKRGEGGMGVVYKAQDIKLDRIVALKFLPKHLLCNAEAKERFVLEAKAASALNHPNISTIHEIDEVEGECFIVMEYVAGKSLKELLKEKSFSKKEVLEIATQIAEGLNIAHKKGIVHRDIKSDNIMLTDEGLVKIMDFGLAKLRGVSGLTKAGTTLGTMQYMSPEQVQGLEIDQRSDIFSFGVVLYEMIAGQLPFQGEYEATIIYSIINETPEPLKNYNSEIPEGLQKIVDKTLEKDVDLRYQNLSELISDFEKLVKGEEVSGVVPKRRYLKFMVMGVGVFGLALLIFMLFWFFKSFQRVPSVPTLAVLYLENLGEKTDDYFVAGMTDAIITDLSKLGGLRVLSRSDVAPYRGKAVDIKELGKKLSVDFIIEGSIQKADHMLRITAQLIKTKDGFQVWADKFTRELKSVFEVQDEVSEGIVSALKVKLSPLEKNRIEKKPTGSIQAYDYYLKGMDYFWKGSQRDLDLALEMFNKALEIDSNYALAYSGIGEVYATKYNYQRTLDWLDKAEKMAKKALVLDPELAEARLTLGRVYDFERKNTMAIEEFKKVAELIPNSNDPYRRLGYVYLYNLYDYTEAINFFQKALEIRPTDAKSYRGLGIAYTSLRRYDEGIKSIKKGLEISPDDIYLLTFLADAYRYKKMFNQALEIYSKALKYYPDDPTISYYIGGLVFYSKKDYAKAIEVFEKSIKQGISEFMVLVNIGSAYQHKGDKREAKVFLDSSVYACKKVLEKEPQNAWALSQLGLSYALLGYEKEAIENGNLAIKTEFSPEQIYNLALIYAVLKEDDLALKTLEQVCMKDPSYIDIAALEPDFEKLKNHPKFQKLLKKRY